MEFRRPAVKIVQGRHTLFLTFLPVRDFTKEFYRVDRLDVKGGKGMQRLLDRRRARSFGKDVLEAYKHNEAFLPTSVFLATGKSINYDEEKKELYFDSDPRLGVCPLDVVDGQHRIEGLIEAARGEKGEKHLLDFPISTAIAPDLTEARKMLQFAIVNMQQKTVDSGVVEHITARLHKMLEVEETPRYLPRWLRRRAEMGDDAKALAIALALNDDKESPWHGRIQFADEEKKPHRYTIRQASFVKSVKKYILRPTYRFSDEKRIKILINFWTAIENIFVAPLAKDGVKVDSVVFGSTGLAFFHPIFDSIIHNLSVKGEPYTTKAIENCIRSVEDFPEGKDIMSPKFWVKGNSASKWNPSVATKNAANFQHALAESPGYDIQV